MGQPGTTLIYYHFILKKVSENHLQNKKSIHDRFIFIPERGEGRDLVSISFASLSINLSIYSSIYSSIFLFFSLYQYYVYHLSIYLSLYTKKIDKYLYKHTCIYFNLHRQTTLALYLSIYLSISSLPEKPQSHISLAKMFYT